jgi:hypothetical protein
MKGAVAKRVAVLVRERQGEALRVAAGLTLKAGVEVYVLDRKVADTPEHRSYLDVLKEIGVRVATNCADNADLELLSNADIARRIVACDVILPY